MTDPAVSGPTHNDESQNSLPLATLNVALGDRSYDIFIGDGALRQAGDLMRDVLASPNTVIVTDENVAPHWLAPLEASLNAAGIAHRAMILPPGEHTKSLKYLDELTDGLLRDGIDRKTTLIALGGGVIGDLTGFAAAVLLRGIDFVQVPTTLLAQVDSSVGGKTGIDTRYGKNLIGAFHQPKVVIADTQTLDTLPRRELLCGYAEVVKYGVINDPAFFDWLRANAAALLDGDGAVRREAVLRSCTSKAEIVAADERESGVRALLNLGHTFAHALEAQVGFEDKLKHGEAVAIGMVMALDLSARLKMGGITARDRLVAHLQDVGLPTNIKALLGDNWTADALLDHMGRDKKTEGGKLTFILAGDIGQSEVVRDVDPAAVTQTLNAFIAAAR